MNERIFIATSDQEIEACYPVMSELRPHIHADEFLSRVARQAKDGYQLACIMDGEVKAVAGFRISENLAWGKFLYVDDLVAKAEERSRGYGGALFDWLVALARTNRCDQFHLDSGVQRFAAHRFYLVKRMIISSHHFYIDLMKD
jgi:GNAT superfamily N-acetyltransferase